MSFSQIGGMASKNYEVRRAKGENEPNGEHKGFQGFGEAEGSGAGGAEGVGAASGGDEWRDAGGLASEGGVEGVSAGDVDLSSGDSISKSSGSGGLPS